MCRRSSRHWENRRVAAGPPPPWPRTWDWNGFYGGINAGFSFGRARDTWNIPTLSVTGEDAEKFSGPLGGIQAGWNWQYSVFLVGFEADIDFGAEKAKQATFNSAFTTPTTIPVQGTVSVTHSGTINWFGTVGGRFGVALGPALFYGTGGLAWAAGKEHVAGTATNAGDGSTAVLIQPSSLNPIMLGWTAGGGSRWLSAIIGPSGPNICLLIWARQGGALLRKQPLLASYQAAH